jgi:Domain of unknown function (DUF4845)
MYVFVTLGFVGYVGLRCFNPLMEYVSIKKVLSSMASAELKDGSSVADIRKGFERRAIIDNIQTIKKEDLEVIKEGNDTVITAEWQVKVPIGGIVSIVLDFKVSSQ